jgi:hypothetical protein
VSNQGRAGTWNNLASTVVFRNVGEKEFSFNSTWFGDLEGRASRPLDHEFLLPALERHARLDQPGPRLTVLHSYAGHGPYLRSIADDFKQPVDDFLEALRSLPSSEPVWRIRTESYEPSKNTILPCGTWTTLSLLR